MGRRGQIRIGQIVACEPVPAGDQIADILQMIAQIGARRPDRVHVRRPPLRGPMKRLKIFSVTRWPVTSSLELAEEPVKEPAHLDAGGGLLGQQPAAVEAAAARLVEIFRDDPGAGRDDLAVDEGRRRSGRVEPEILDPTLPGPLFLQLRLQPDLGEHETHEARARAEGVMVEGCHSKARGLARGRGLIGRAGLGRRCP